LREKKQWKCRESKSEALCGNALNYVAVTVIWLQVGRYIVWTKETVNEYRNLIGNLIGKLPFGSRCAEDKLTAAAIKEFERTMFKLYEVRLQRLGMFVYKQRRIFCLLF
jgi:hypothetical protein